MRYINWDSLVKIFLQVKSGNTYMNEINKCTSQHILVDTLEAPGLNIRMLFLRSVYKDGSHLTL